MSAKDLEKQEKVIVKHKKTFWGVDGKVCEKGKTETVSGKEALEYLRAGASEIQKDTKTEKATK